MEELFNGVTSKAELDNENKMILFTFSGYAEISELKTMFLEVVDFAQEEGNVEGFIFNFKKMNGIFTGISEWVVETLRPLTEVSLKKVALVVSNDLLVNFSIKETVKLVRIVELERFDNLESAKKWIVE